MKPITNPGAKPRPLDMRDLQLGKAAIDAPILDSFMSDRAFSLPIYFQGTQPACSAHAAAWLKNMLGDLDIASPRYTWEDIKSFDGYPIEDGTDMRSLFKSLQHGVLPLAEVPNDVTLSDTTYAAPTDLTLENKARAGQDIIDSYAFQDAPTFQQLKELIYQHGAVVLLIAIGPEFYTAPDGHTSWAETDILPLRTPVKVTSHHFVVAHSYSEDAIWFANSFGPSWGRNGHGYFGADYMPYVLEAGTAIDHATAVSISEKLGLLSNTLLQTQDPTSPAVQKLAAALKKIGL